MNQLKIFKENICDEFKGPEPKFRNKEEYYHSNIWQGVRRRILRRDGYKCRGWALLMNNPKRKKEIIRKRKEIISV